MQFTVYQNTDASAPVYNGTVGSAVALLDACLVNGYGSKVAAGWTKPFVGTNKAAFRQGGGAQRYMRCQDDGPGAHGGRESRMTAYEAMTDVDNGTNPMPTAAQGVAGIAMQVLRKSATADATARPWVVFADNKTCYIFVQSGDSAGRWLFFPFGDYFSLLPGDQYNFWMSGRAAEASTALTNDTGDLLSTTLAQVTNSHYFFRAHTGLGGPINFGVHTGDAVKANNHTVMGDMSGGAATVPVPNLPNGGLFMARIWVHDPTTPPLYTIRGRLRGLWDFLHFNGGTVTGPADRQIIAGTGDLAGRSFMFLKNGGNAANSGSMFAVEISDTLE